MRPPRPGLPHANSALALFVHKRIDDLRGVKTQREIGMEAGYDRPNVISMFKRGETKVPMERLPALARALQADPAHMFRLGLKDTWPEMAAVIDTVFGRQMASAHEAAIFLQKWRALTSDLDPAPTAQINDAVDAMLAGLLKGS